MPINYKLYPTNWKSEIVPRIIARANNCCEKCGVENYSIVYSVRRNAKSTWFKTLEEALLAPKTNEAKKNKITGRLEIIPNPKPVKVILTIAHLDHDELNWDVTDDRLMAMCQKCHLTYDGYEKYLRRNNLNKDEPNNNSTLPK